MKEALRNFALVTALVLICAFIAWGFLRLQAQAQTVKPPLNHPFLKNPGLDVVAYHVFPATQHPAYRIEELKKLAVLSPQLVLWIDVRPAGPRPEDSDLVAAVSEEDAPGAPKLTEILKAIPENRMILNFRANRPHMKEIATAIIENAKADSRILIQSPEDGFLKELREDRPLWIYGSSVARVTQLEMLTSIALEPMAPLKGDALVIEFATERSTLKSQVDKIIQEGHRRRMKVYVGPVSAQEAERYRALGADGLLTPEPGPVLNQALR